MVMRDPHSGSMCTAGHVLHNSVMNVLAVVLCYKAIERVGLYLGSSLAAVPAECGAALVMMAKIQRRWPCAQGQKQWQQTLNPILLSPWKISGSEPMFEPCVFPLA